MQPLDISVFSAVKGAYRTELAKEDVILDFSPISKMTFLSYYAKGRAVGLMESNIKAGWRGAGLWPVNVSKPLMSPYVMQPLMGALPVALNTTYSTYEDEMKLKELHEADIPTSQASHQVRKVIRGSSRIRWLTQR